MLWSILILLVKEGEEEKYLGKILLFLEPAGVFLLLFVI